MRAKKIIFLLLVLVFLSFTTGCLGVLFNNKPIIESTPDTTAKVGIEYTYEIEATDPDADDILTYSLTEKPTGMTINTSTGAVSWTPTEAQVGDHQVIIEVSDGKVSVSQNFTITVEEALLDSIEVLPSEMTVYIGDSEDITSITANYDNETDADIELDSDDVSYSSDDEEIATVSDLGVVTGVSTGITTITVSYTEGGIIETAVINVTVPSVLTVISVQPEFISIYEGASESITSITAYYEGGTNALIELSSADYSSSHPGIATVDSSGVITGVSASEEIIVTITITYTEGEVTKTDTVYVTVQEAPVILDSITVLPPTMTLVEDVSGNIDTIRAYYSDGSYVDIEGADLTSEDISYDSNNEAVATVDNSGVITGISAGTAIIAVSYTETGITRTDTVVVTVIE